MEYCILSADGVIENIIVAEADFAETLGLLPAYDGAAIGSKYDPPDPEPETAEPTETDDLAAMAVDHEYRLMLLELGLTEEV